jgi:nicotinamide-nucleotide amidase
MKDIINQVHRFLIKNKKTIAVAESCSGGLLSSLLTQISGSSQYFILGIIAYSNKAKKTLLKIPSSLLTKYGAVSEEVSNMMAQQIRRIAKTDFGIGITGIAGPTGGTEQKPRGTVFIAIDSRTEKFCKKFHFQGSRLKIRKTAALKTLELLKGIL